MNSDPSSAPPNRKAELRDKINATFSPDDLHGLALDFGLDYDELPGDSKARRVVELIEIVVRREQVPEFIERCHALKPRGNFQSLLEAARQEPQIFYVEHETAASSTAESKLLGIAMELLKYQSLKKDDFPHASQNAFAKARSPEQTRADLGAVGRSNETWAKSSKIQSAAEPSHSQSSRYGDKIGLEQGSSVRMSKLHKEIARLEENITLLGEIDDVLEDVLKNIRDLKLKLTVQHQRVQDETLQAEEAPKPPLGTLQTYSQINRSATSSPQTSTNPYHERKSLRYS